MSHAEQCPICYGAGKITKPKNPDITGVNFPATCWGCGGLGWVTVKDGHDEPRLINAFNTEEK